MISPDPGRREAARQFALGAIMALVLVYTAMTGFRAGWAHWLPGDMNRHRDAVAVAITAVAYGKWQGYASYKAVNHTLRESGLSVQEEDLARAGAAHYFDVMTDPARLNAALKAASSLQAPAAEGMYYSQDERGVAALYTAAFALFGISSSSLFCLYLTLYSVSVLVAFIAFRRRGEILFFFLAAVCVHALLAHLLPLIPRQDINVIQGNRFVGIMASVPVFHLMFLMLQRERPTAGQIAGAALQTAILCLVVNARASAAWLVVALLVSWMILWLGWLLRRVRSGVRGPGPGSWPLGVLAIGLAGLLLHQQHGKDPEFRRSQPTRGHVFWHNLVTALHNNPQRTERYQIPAEYAVHDDNVAFVIFDREITRRNDDYSRYLMQDADWVYRTANPDRDFRWRAYDHVLRWVFVRTVAMDPRYAGYSFLVQQPLSALRLVLGGDFLRSPYLLLPLPLVALALGLLLAAGSIARSPASCVVAAGAASVAVTLPVLSAAVFELRVVELFYVLLLDTVVAVAIIAAISGRALISKVSRRGASV